MTARQRVGRRRSGRLSTVASFRFRHEVGECGSAPGVWGRSDVDDHVRGVMIMASGTCCLTCPVCGSGACVWSRDRPGWRRTFRLAGRRVRAAGLGPRGCTAGTGVSWQSWRSVVGRRRSIKWTMEKLLLLWCNELRGCQMRPAVTRPSKMSKVSSVAFVRREALLFKWR